MNLSEFIKKLQELERQGYGQLKVMTNYSYEVGDAIYIKDEENCSIHKEVIEIRERL